MKSLQPQSQNTNPTVDSIAIEPTDDITPESTLSCSASASDIDGGTPTLSCCWEREESLSSVYRHSIFAYCWRRFDGGYIYLCGNRSTNMVVKQQTAPVSRWVTLSSIEADVRIVVAGNPDLPFTSQLDVKCIGDEIGDPNDDEVTLSYQWYINGNLQTENGSRHSHRTLSVGDDRLSGHTQRCRT